MLHTHTPDPNLISSFRFSPNKTKKNVKNRVEREEMKAPELISGLTEVVQSFQQLE